MAKQPDNMLYVQLEAGAFLSDADYQMWTAEQRGIYCSVIFYLYANGGKISLNGNSDQGLLNGCYNGVIALLSNCQKTGEDWKKTWLPVEKKFQIQNGILTHKRVTRELLRAAKLRKQKSLAGKKGMQHRYNSVSNTDITKVSKLKLSKDISNLETKKEISGDLVLEIQKEAMALHDRIEKKLGPLLPAEQKTFRNIVSFLVKSSRECRSVDPVSQARAILGDKIDYCERRQKSMSEAKKMFVASIKKEFGYNNKEAK